MPRNAAYSSSDTMMDTLAGAHDDTVIIQRREVAEIRWGTQRMVCLGGDPELAAKIADSDADVHDIERLLKAGCTLELAWTIMRPVDKPPGAPSAAAESSD